ncbi:MAG: BREX-1 system adenine-specific DNA-methyltransferase PglX [Oscillospiraceae bacterium]|nr:BREX-1 system adenine-specific DNA-methyltransferase PglX [Oscillospiraceae bacterium]
MNNTPIIFSREILNRYLSAFKSEQIPDYDNKLKEIFKWKKTIDSRDLNKTKEGSAQGKFFDSIIEKVLGYSSVVESDESGGFTLVQEATTILDSTESDGILGFFVADNKENVRAVIELKDANTDLDKKQNRKNHQSPVEQAFAYAHKNGTGCRWVIVSNFKEIRLYRSTSSLEYEKFLIAGMDNKEEFKRFYFLLCKDNLIGEPDTAKSLVDKIYDDNEQKKIEISNSFYNDYKSLRYNLFVSMKENNTGFDEVVLFSKAQKVIDRFIFICFCENRGLLPKDIFRKVIDSPQSSFIIVENRLWNELKGLFRSIDKGYPPMKINGYNGGLFKEDDVLDELVVPDKVLENFTKLSEYDFGSDLNVNILGNIFEQSISDLERFKAELAGTSVILKTSKRKTDGIFYTPYYVTAFIVKKTIARWLNDEKEKIKQKLGSQEDKTFWLSYIEVLKSIKVLDPSCGSGAFLNQAFDFLREEGEYAVKMYAEVTGGMDMLLLDWDVEILQNNLYGVDLNVESVEITKLSLWLKTARADRKLTTLDENIKCGNSIINSCEVAGDSAFDWCAEFPSVMKAGGFDVVIGNPPYGANLSQSEKDYIAANYITTEYNFDTYKTFMEIGLNLTKQGGYMGYITPNTYFVLEKGASKLRKFLFENYTLLDIVELFNVFSAAVVEPTISVFKKEQPNDNEVLEVRLIPRKTDLTSDFSINGTHTTFLQKNLREKQGYIFNYRETAEEKSLMEKIKGISKPLSDYFTVSFGVKLYQVGKGTPPQTSEIITTKPFCGYEKYNEEWLPLIRGSTIRKYTDLWDGKYIKYGKWLAEPRSIELFQSAKILIRQTGDYPIATYDPNGRIAAPTTHCILPLNEQNDISLKYVLGLINSRLLKWIFQHSNFHMVNKPLSQVKVIYVERLPIVVADDQSQVISLVDKLLEKNQERFAQAKQFTDYLSVTYSPKKISDKLSVFYKLDFKGFIDELKKQGVKFSPTQEIEFMPLFNEKAGELVELSREIVRLDSELDEVVFELYGLTATERSII